MERTKKEIEELFNMYLRMHKLPFLDGELDILFSVIEEISEK